MKTCPNCNEVNGDNNSKCFKCGATLPMPEPSFEFSESQKKNNIQQQESLPEIPNSKKIMNLATAVEIIGIIASVILGFVFQTATVNVGLYSTTTKYSFNWGLCVSGAVGSICFAIILIAMSYIAKAIEEK